MSLKAQLLHAFQFTPTGEAWRRLSTHLGDASGVVLSARSIHSLKADVISRVNWSTGRGLGIWSSEFRL